MSSLKKSLYKNLISAWLAIWIFISSITVVYADDLRSNNFILRNPIISEGGGTLSTSSNFQHFGNVAGEIIIGENSSSNFTIKSGGITYGSEVLVQNNFRWYKNISSPPTLFEPLAAEGSEITVSKDSLVRLRLGVKATSEPYPSNSIFKLQYGQRVTTCQSATYFDVGGSGSLLPWIGHDNPLLNDGAQILSPQLSTSAFASRQTYEEFNNSAGTPTVIFVGTNSDGEWDWSLKYQGENDNSAYCFRMVLSSGTALNTYSSYPVALIQAGGGALVLNATPTSTTSISDTSTTGESDLQSSSVEFTGKAYPNSQIVLLKDAQNAGKFTSSANGDFKINLSDLTPGTYNFTIYALDSKGQKSNSFSKSIEIIKSESKKISNIIIPPTIYINKSEVKQGEPINVFGESSPNSEISILINSATENKIIVSKISDENGAFSYSLDTNILEMGTHNVKAQSQNSTFSPILEFIVSTQTILSEVVQNLLGDINSVSGGISGEGSAGEESQGDGLVNLVDFSILAYWFAREIPEKILIIIDLNQDGILDLKDFSILASNWTG